MEEGVWSKVINGSEQVFIGVFLLHMSRGVYLKKGQGWLNGNEASRGSYVLLEVIC